MNWDYADLSHLAKEFGGAKKCMHIIKSHKTITRASIAMVPFATIGVFNVCRNSLQKIKTHRQSKLPSQEGAKNPTDGIENTP